MMRRNKRGHGFSGSIEYLCRALKTTAEELVAQLGTLGLRMPQNADERLDAVAIGRFEWYLNKAANGQLWINGREKRAERPQKPAPAEGAPAAEGGASPEGSAPAEAPATGEAATSQTAQAVVVEGGTDAGGAAPEGVSPEAAPSAPEPVSAAEGVVPASESSDTPAAVDAAPESGEEVVDEAGDEADEAASAPSEESVWLAGLREQMKRAKRGGPLTATIASLAETLQVERLALLERLVRLGMNMPGDGEAPVKVEADGFLHWLGEDADQAPELCAKEKPRRAPRRSRSGRSRG